MGRPASPHSAPGAVSSAYAHSNNHLIIFRRYCCLPMLPVMQVVGWEVEGLLAPVLSHMSLGKL
jgi:hypothetical protein